MKGCAFRGVATAVPRNVVSNDQFIEILGGATPAKRLFGSVGIQERRWAPEGMTALDLCVAAGERLLQDLPGGRADIGAVVMVTQSPEFFISPASACVAQWKLGLSKQCLAFDVNQGCTGFIYALSIAKGLIAGGMAKKVLLLVGDTLSRLCNPSDMSTSPLFGDAGTACLVEASDRSDLAEFFFETDGSGWDVLATPVGGNRYRTLDAYHRDADPALQNYFKYPCDVNMDGDKVFSFCMANVPRLVQAIADANQMDVATLDFSIFHQANLMMIEALRRKSGLAKDTFLLSIGSFGNTTVATIPVTMTHQAERLRNGGRCLLAAFGVGLSLAGTVLNLAPDTVYSPLVEL